MSKEKQPDVNPDPSGTGKDPNPAGNPNSNDPSSAPVDPSKITLPEGFELIKTEDKKNLISARDKANNKNSESDLILNSLVQKDAVRDAMKSSDFLEKYPDVSEEEILEANPTSDEEILVIAKAKQDRYDKVKINAVKKVQGKTSAPEISAADREEKLKALKKPAPRSRFAEALKLKRMKVK